MKQTYLNFETVSESELQAIDGGSTVATRGTSGFFTVLDPVTRLPKRSKWIYT